MNLDLKIVDEICCKYEYVKPPEISNPLNGLVKHIENLVTEAIMSDVEKFDFKSMKMDYRRVVDILEQCS